MLVENRMDRFCRGVFAVLVRWDNSFSQFGALPSCTEMGLEGL